ncbi:MAG: transglycosylase SLT domain-containing protein [Bdellovibrionota bacterium]
MNSVAAKKFFGAGIVFATLVSFAQDTPSTTPRFISLERAIVLAAASPSDKGFPAIVNEDVVVQLNKMLTQSWSRKSLKKALDRLEELKPMLQEESNLEQTPWELMAIAFVESNFRNPTQSANRWKSAGLWQFTRNSGRAHGLKVTAKKGERLDMQKATRAALRYLKRNREDLGNWPLAILGYNVGPAKVKKIMDAMSSDDAFEIVKSGPLGGDPEYLAKVMASVIILKNPSLLDLKDGAPELPMLSSEPSIPNEPPRLIPPRFVERSGRHLN